MSTDRDVTRIVRSWLEEGRTALPDRVLDTVLDQLPATPQRRAWWPARRLREMHIPTRIAVAAAAVVALAVVGALALPRPSGVATSPPSASAAPPVSPASSASAAPSASTAPPPAIPSDSPSTLNHVGRFAPGTTYTIDDPCCVGPSRMTFTVPATGWAAFDPVFVGKNVAGGGDVFDLYFSPHLVGNVYTGGCHWLGTALTPPVGPTVDDLATALLAQAGPGASRPIAVTVGGHHGKKVELSIPKDLDVTTCDSDGDFPIFGRWYTGVPDRSGAAPWTYGNGQHNTVYIVDVDGTRQVIDTMYLPGTSPADRAEIDQIVASIRFVSPASPSPSP
jgi:hypothetical protein